MAAATHVFGFDGALLERGFWLYVWEITTPTGKVVHYVGRTGDSSSNHAQSPFNRMGQHLGFNKASNTLRRWLSKEVGVEAEGCSFRLIAHGPVVAEVAEKDRNTAKGTAEHRKRRDVVAGLEKQLAESMKAGGYVVLNKVDSHKPLDAKLWKEVKSAFSAEFPKLEGAG